LALFRTGKTAAARLEAAALKRKIDAGGDPVGDIVEGRAAPTVNDLCDRFIADYVPRKRASTQTSYKQIINAEVRPALGRLKVGAVTFADIDGVHQAITKRGRLYRANRVLSLLSHIFTLAIKWKMRPDNPCKGIERNEEHQRRTGTVSSRGDTACDMESGIRVSVDPSGYRLSASRMSIV
jgi:hypothetical protein